MKSWLMALGLTMFILLPSVQAVATDDLLDPEQAFVLSVTARDAETAVAEWSIAEGYYLYRERLDFESTTPGIELKEPRFPSGKVIEDEFFGEMEIYRDVITIEIPLVREADAPQQMEIQASYQGCADVGVCYPPLTETIPLLLPPIPDAQAAPADAEPTPSAPADAEPTPSAPADAEPTPSAPADAGPPAGMVAEQDIISRMLVEQRFWAMPAFFGFGLLLAFTPCVFPMIPILSSIIVGQGESLTQRRAFMLSLIYVLAMALTYTIVGVMAAQLGQNIQAWFQNPWVLSSFSAVFVLLALSMFGFYDLQLPASWQSKLSEFSNRQGGGSYTGVAIMGLLSALIVGPCVAPPLIGVLTVIAATGDAMLGGSALFLMSLGMGAPLLVIGTSAGQFMPRAGHWMDAVKAVFGVLLLAVAIWMLERVLPPAITMLLWAVLIIVSATYMGVFQPLRADTPRWQFLIKGIGIVLLIYGILLLVGMAAGGKDPLQPLHGIGFASTEQPTQQHMEFKTIKTVADLEQEIRQAGNRPVMLDFYADWCVACKELEKYTFSNPDVQALWSRTDTVLLKADVTANDAADRELMRHFNIIGPPAVLFFDPDGTEHRDYRVVGFMPAERFKEHLDQALHL